MLMPEKRSWLKFSIALTAFVLSVLSVTGYALWLLRVDAINSNFRIATLLVQSFENLITQSLDAPNANEFESHFALLALLSKPSRIPERRRI